MVDNIPPEYRTEEAIRNQFSKFGPLEHVELVDNFALIKYSTVEEAKRCLSSPDVIFNNRFVKVYYQPPQLTKKLESELTEKEESERLAKLKLMEKITARRKEEVQVLMAKKESLLERIRTEENISTDEKVKLQDELSILIGSIEIKQKQILAAAKVDSQAKESKQFFKLIIEKISEEKYQNYKKDIENLDGFESLIKEGEGCVLSFRDQTSAEQVRFFN